MWWDLLLSGESRPMVPGMQSHPGALRATRAARKTPSLPRSGLKLAHTHFFRGERSKRQSLNWEWAFPNSFSLPAVPGPPIALALLSRPSAVPLLPFCSHLLRKESQSSRPSSSEHSRGCACRATAMQQQAVLVSLAGAGGILALPLPPAPSFQPLHQPCFAHGPDCRAFLQ